MPVDPEVVRQANREANWAFFRRILAYGIGLAIAAYLVHTGEYVWVWDAVP